MKRHKVEQPGKAAEIACLNGLCAVAHTNFAPMLMTHPTRRSRARQSAALLLCVALTSAAFGQGNIRPAPRNNGGGGGMRIPGTQGGVNAAGRPRGEHLSTWMQQHSTMNFNQQQKALTQEPGFTQLPQPTQQRMMDRLQHLNTMPPQQRDRVIARNEAMEHMTQDQRINVRNAMGQLSNLPQDRRRMVARSFRDLRALPVPQRNALLNSPEYHQQFSDEERGTLGNLLAVSPLLPANQ